MEICHFKDYIQNNSLFIAFIDKMAEWIRRWTVNPLGYTSVGSNPIFVVFFIWFYGEMDSNLQFEFSNQNSNLGKKIVIFKSSATTIFEIWKKKLMTMWKTMSDWQS